MEKVYVETQQEKCWLERSKVWKFCLPEKKKQSCQQVKWQRWRKAKVMKICDVVIYLQFARDGGDFQMRKKLSVSSIAF